MVEFGFLVRSKRLENFSEAFLDGKLQTYIGCKFEWWFHTSDPLPKFWVVQFLPYLDGLETVCLCPVNGFSVVSLRLTVSMTFTLQMFAIVLYVRPSTMHLTWFENLLRFAWLDSELVPTTYSKCDCRKGSAFNWTYEDLRKIRSKMWTAKPIGFLWFGCLVSPTPTASPTRAAPTDESVDTFRLPNFSVSSVIVTY